MPSRMDGRIAAFVGVAMLLTITPGVDMALVTRQGLAHGRQAALRGDNVLLRSLLLTCIHVALGLIWLSSYSMAVSRGGEYLRRPKVRQALDRLTGAVLIAFGARLAFDRH